MNKLKALFSPKAVVATAALATVAMAPDAKAGTAGTEFDAIYTLLVGWSQGTLGKIISLGMFLVGLSAGIVNQSIVSVVIGLGGALAVYYGPNIISNVVSALI